MLLLTGCDRPERVFALSGYTMGTEWSVQLVARPGWRELGAVRGEIEVVLEAVNSQMSTFREDSDISRFNRSLAGETIPLRDEFRAVLDAALQLAEQTDGAYDPTVGPLVNLWGFGSYESRGAAPDEDEVAAALRRVGWEQLQVLGSGLAPELLQQGGVDLNLSSIAKGYAIDLIAERLESMGVSAYLVSIGGDMRLRGVRPDGQNWRIGVEHPVPGERRVHLVIEPGDRAVATSGDYRNFFFEDGRLFSHVVDPRSGRPVEANLASVTVLHESAMLADGLATAIMALGPERGYAFAAERDLAVLLLVREGDTFVERVSPQFKPFLAREAPAT
ncbi:MAG: FAD:protein FMN transferase [Chromatiales bacterium]|nr:FAD:protein FMN transferase [Chromatiales bacterium]